MTNISNMQIQIPYDAACRLVSIVALSALYMDTTEAAYAELDAQLL